MSNVIRKVQATWLPLPVASQDVRPTMPKDNYRLAQIAIEAAQRQQQRQIDRQGRLGRQASPAGGRQVKTPYPNIPSSLTVFTIPVR